MIRTLVVATVALLGLGVAPPASRPAAAALIERQNVPGLFRRYDELHFSGGSTTGETGFYDFYFSLGGRPLKTSALAMLFDEDSFVISDGVRAKVKIYSQCCFSSDRRIETAFDLDYVDEKLDIIGEGSALFTGIRRPYRLRIKILDAPPDPFSFTWNGRILPIAPPIFNIRDHGFDATIITDDGVAVTPLPAGAFLLAPALLGLGWAARRSRLRGAMSR